MDDHATTANIDHHFDGWVKHDGEFSHPPFNPCKVCLTDEIEALQAVKTRALELAEYIDDKARGLDDFGDLIAIPSQAWCELLAVLVTRADSGSKEQADG